ncbi:hypothetical protein ACHAQH_005419 [Verticillium albo-atrum]
MEIDGPGSLWSQTFDESPAIDLSQQLIAFLDQSSDVLERIKAKPSHELMASDALFNDDVL